MNTNAAGVVAVYMTRNQAIERDGHIWAPQQHLT